MQRFTKIVAAGILTTSMSVMAGFADTVRIAFVDPLSGPFATTGTNGLAEYEFAAEELVNKKGGVLGGKQFEIVAFDNKMSGKESLIQVQVAIDQGIKFIAQGNSSGIAHAITDAVNKHNRRNPDNRVLFLNYSAVDPALTNEKCNFWHFRFDASVDIKVHSIVQAIRDNKEVKKIILTRPAIEAGESLGFLPGDMKEKLDPYLQPLGSRYIHRRHILPSRHLRGP